MSDAISSEPKNVSIIIPTYKRVDGLSLLLQSIAQQVDPRDGIEVVVIENHAQPMSQIRELCGRLRSQGMDLLLLHQPDPGASNARNLGIQRSSGSWLIFLDDDEEILSGYLAAAIRLIKVASPTSIFGGQCLPVFEAGHPQWVKAEYFYIGYGSEAVQLARGRYLPGGNLILSRQLLERIGLYNPQLGHSGAETGYGEETELLNRAEQSGAVQNYSPALLIVHHIPNSRLTLKWLKAQKRKSAQFKAWYYWQTNPIPREMGKRAGLKLSYLRAALSQGVKIAASTLTANFRDKKAFPCWENYFMERLMTNYSRMQNNLELFRSIHWFPKGRKV